MLRRSSKHSAYALMMKLPLLLPRHRCCSWDVRWFMILQAAVPTTAIELLVKRVGFPLRRLALELRELQAESSHKESTAAHFALRSPHVLNVPAKVK